MAEMKSPNPSARCEFHGSYPPVQAGMCVDHFMSVLVWEELKVDLRSAVERSSCFQGRQFPRNSAVS